MLVKTLLKSCETGFDLVIVADSTSGHTLEFNSVKEAQIVAGGDRIVSWEVGVSIETGSKTVKRNFVLFITI